MRDPRFTHKWTDDDIAKVATLLKQGLSASQIGYAMEVSRNCVISIVHRNASLRGIGFMPQNERPPEVLSLPRCYVTPQHRRHEVERPKLRVVSNNVALMAQDWIERNKPRRFCTGERTDPHTIKQFLADRGYALSGGFEGYNAITGNGVRKMKLRWSGVMAFVDEIRVREGMQPFKRQA